MANSRVRGNDLKIVKALLSPFQQSIAFFVSLVLFFDVFSEGVHGAVIIDLYGVIDDQFDRNVWIDLVGISSQILDGIPHGSQIDHRRNTGKVLHQNPGRVIRYLNRRIVCFLPSCHVEQIRFPYNSTVKFPQKVLNKNFD